MNKIIVVDAREILGTTGRYMRKLLENLQKVDSENTYKVLLPAKAIDQIALDAPNFHKHPVGIRKFTLAEQFVLPRFIKRLSPDIVHFCMTQQPAFYRGRSVTTIHDLTPIYFTNASKHLALYRFRRLVFAWLTRRVARRSRNLIAVSQFTKDAVTSYAHINPEKVTVTYLAADKIVEAPVPISSLSGKQFIFYTGRAHPHKNISALIESFEKLHATFPELILILGGRLDNYKHVSEQAKSSRVSSSIIFTDFVTEGQLRWLYENAKAYVFPSFSEGFGLPGLEAMAHDCPVVSSNTSCLPEVYGEAAHYFNPQNAQDMANKISEVISNDILRDSLIAKGRQQVKKYSWQRMAEQTLEVYKRSLS